MFRDVTDGNTVITFMVGSAIHIVQRLANLLLIYEAQRKCCAFLNERDEIARNFPIYKYSIAYLVCISWSNLKQYYIMHGFTLFRHCASNKQSSIGPSVFLNICKIKMFFLHIEYWINKSKTR